MGQLKSGIESLRKVLLLTEPEVEKVQELLEKHTNRISDLGDKANKGYDVLYLYLLQKFEKTKTTPTAQAKTKLSAIMDPGLQQCVDGMNQWKGDLKEAIKKMNVSMEGAKGGLLKTLQAVESEAMKLGSLAQQKQKKLFKNAEYKEKIKNYLISLNEIVREVRKQKQAVEGATSSMTNDWVDKAFPISTEITVEQAQKLASVDLEYQLKSFEESKMQITENVRKWRQSTKGVSGQLGVMKRWMDEADKMEKEAN